MRLLIIVFFTLSAVLSAQEPPKPILGTSKDGKHSGTNHQDDVANAAIQNVLNTDSYTAEQKQRLIKSIRLANAPDALEAAMKDSNLKIDKSAVYWGQMQIYGIFDTTEISGCWTDTSHLSATVKIYKQGRMLIGEMQPPGSIPLYHHTGQRCNNSDQGPMITDSKSVKIRMLGYLDRSVKTENDKQAKGENTRKGGYYFMLEPNDRTRWTLASGGDIGTTSFLRAYLPHMYSSTTSTGGLSGMFITEKQMQSKTPLTFRGTVTGSGAKTKGIVGVLFYPRWFGTTLPDKLSVDFANGINDEYKNANTSAVP
ncbi:MAG: hypothetical protein AB8G99_23585 [Planctomycetaceae bacterium]